MKTRGRNHPAVLRDGFERFAHFFAGWGGRCGRIELTSGKPSLPLGPVVEPGSSRCTSVPKNLAARSDWGLRLIQKAATAACDRIQFTDLSQVCQGDGMDQNITAGCFWECLLSKPSHCLFIWT